MSWPSNYSVADLVVKHKKQLQPTTMTIARELTFKDMLCHFHVSQAHQGVLSCHIMRSRCVVMCNEGTAVVVRIPEHVAHCGVCTRVVLQSLV